MTVRIFKSLYRDRFNTRPGASVIRRRQIEINSSVLRGFDDLVLFLPHI